MRHSILTSSTGAPDNFDNGEQVDWLCDRLYSPLWIKNSNNLFPRTAWHQGPIGAFFDLVQSGELWLPSGELWLPSGGFTPNRGVLPVKGNSVYKALWRKVTGLMGLESHVNVTFRLARFWFILVTLVMCRHLVLTAYSKASSTIFSFLLFTSANRRVAVETTEELWAELLSGVFWRPTAHCAPVTATQVEDVLACCSPWGRRVRDDWVTKRNCSKLRWSSCSYRTCPQASSSSSYPAVVTGASRALGKVSFLAEWNVPGLVSHYFCPLKFHTLFAGTFPTEGSQVALAGRRLELGTFSQSSLRPEARPPSFGCIRYSGPREYRFKRELN